MLLEELCNSIAPSGYEGEVRKVIQSELNRLNLNFSIDKMGNILVHKQNKSKEKVLKVMLAAHMDEAGLVITGYNNDGTLRFSTLGNIDKNSLPCKVVLIGKNRIKGVIGLKPIHLQSREEKNCEVSLKDICMDIGAVSAEEARSIVNLGDSAVFDVKFEKFPDNIIKAKALNDRIGCLALLEILKENYSCDLYISFNIQENIGERGASISIYNVKPDIFISVDAICTSKLEHVELGKGPIIPFKDGICIFDREVVKFIRDTASRLHIPYQNIACIKRERKVTSVQTMSLNSKLCSILMPCRYMNSAVSMCNMEDYKSMVAILKIYLESF
ncbi:M42 family metallopeptidase [Clostridium sp. LBM24168]